MMPNLPLPTANPKGDPQGEGRREPQRRCVGCRGLFPRSHLWRVVRLAGAGEPVVQLDQGMGRSAYVCREVTCLQQARRKQRFNQALKTSVPSQVYDELEQRLHAKLPLF